MAWGYTGTGLYGHRSVGARGGTGGANPEATAAPATRNVGSYRGEIVPFVNRTCDWGVVIATVLSVFEYCASPLRPTSFTPNGGK